MPACACDLLECGHDFTMRRQCSRKSRKTKRAMHITTLPRGVVHRLHPCAQRVAICNRRQFYCTVVSVRTNDERRKIRAHQYSGQLKKHLAIHRSRCARQDIVGQIDSDRQMSEQNARGLAAKSEAATRCRRERRMFPENWKYT